MQSWIHQPEDSLRRRLLPAVRQRPESAQADRRAQIKRLRSLGRRDVTGAEQTFFRGRRARRLHSQQIAFQTMKLRLAEGFTSRSEEHTSELQSRLHLVCRL